MAKLPKKFTDRLATKLKKYQSLVTNHRTRDVSEADTVTVIKDALAELFGYDKYSELTSEHQIRGTFCDLAITVEGKIKFLIEVKAAGVDLNDNHLRQVINYGANQGISWVVLTNSLEWRLYKIIFGQPISHEEVARFFLPVISLKREDDLQKLFLLAREGLTADAITSFHQQVQQFNRYTVAQIIISEPVTNLVRKELRRLFPELKIDISHIENLMINEIIKRDTLEDEQVKEAQQRIKKAMQKLNRALGKDKGMTAQNMVDIAKEEAQPKIIT